MGLDGSPMETGTKLNAREASLARPVFTTDRVGGIRLGIEGLVLRWSPRLVDKDDRFGSGWQVGRRLDRFGLQPQDIGETRAHEGETAQFEEFPAANGEVIAGVTAGISHKLIPQNGCTWTVS